MSYAVRKDGLGWRAIDSIDQVDLVTETFAAAPPQVDSLAKAKQSQIAVLSAACQAQIYAGFTSNALGTVRTYPAKDRDQQNLTASVLASTLPGVGPGWTTPFWCADAAGVWSLAPHTAGQIQQVGIDATAAILTAITKNTNLGNQVMAATTVAQVQAIVW